jgi:energy-coupling factor transporter ATP-binding protein EcfA2
MQIIKLVLKGYKRLFLSHINKIEYTPINKINLILGSNGSGKSSFFKELSPLPADMKEFDEDGYKEIIIMHNNDTYHLTSGVVATNKHSFKVNDIELNPAGTKKVQLNLVKEHFNLTPEIHTVMLGLKGFTSMSVMERKNWLTNISTVDYTYAISIYNKLKQRNRDIVGAIKISQSELSKNTSSILNKEDKDSMILDIQMMRSLIKSLLESKIIIPNKVNIDNRYIIDTLALANNLIKNSVRLNDVNPRNIENIIYNTTNNIKKYKDKVIELETTLKELDYLENTVSFNNIELETMIVNKREEITNLTNSLYLDIDIKNISEYKTLFEYTYSKIYDVLLEISNNSIDDYTINEYKIDVQDISNMKTSINNNIVVINKLELDKSNMEHNRDHNGIECNKCGNQWSIGFNETEYNYLIKKIAEFNNKNIVLDKSILDIKNRTDVFDKKLDAIKTIQGMFTDINLKPLQTTFRYLNEKSNIMLSPNKTIDLLNNINNDLELWKAYPYLYNELEDLYKTKKVSDEKIAIELKHHNANKSKIEEEYYIIKNELWVNTKNLELYEEYKNSLYKMKDVYKILSNFIKASNSNNKIDMENYRLSIINETVTMLDMEVSKLENKISESNYNERLIDDNKNKVIELNKRKEVTDKLIDCMSPSNGLIGKSITNFLNVFTKDMNEIINSIWNYNMEILPCNITDTNDLDYRFEVLVDNRNKIDDVSKTSSSMQEIIDLAFKIVSMKYLRMENSYLLLDEFGRTFDTVHAKNAYDIIDILANSSFSNVFIISHFEGTYGRFKNADISVLNNDNLLLNKDIEINKVMKIS